MTKVKLYADDDSRFKKNNLLLQEIKYQLNKL
jgi:hypothetical protein